MAFAPITKYRNYRERTIKEFYEHIDDIIDHEKVQQLENYKQHFCFTRLEHSLDVAYYSFFVSKLFGWDAKSAARGGLLHDLFLYDRHIDDYKVKKHLRLHPIVAFHTAKEVCELNEVEADIIKKHMWLVTMIPPKYKEGYVVTFVDKYCALREGVVGAFVANPDRSKKKHARVV